MTEEMSPLIHARGDFVVKQMESELQKYLETIKGIFPPDISDVTLHDNGDDFLVLEINHEWMFRFPRNEVSRKALEIEKRFLARFKSRSPLPVPDHRYLENDFVGYPKILGDLLIRGLFKDLSRQSHERIARQMGEFLAEVHSFPLDEAKRIGVTEGWDGWHAKILNNFRETVAPMLSPSARQKGIARIDQMVAEPFETRVIHGDFALEDHVFFDARRQELSGVIDFADVTLNDPAHDFQNILEYGGEVFFEAVMKHYRGRADPALLQRTKLRIQVRPLFEASASMLFGFEKRLKERMRYIEELYG